jgi:hypothetical protein
LGSVVERLAAAASISEARRLAVEGREPVRNLLSELRNSAPTILDEFLLDIRSNNNINQAERRKQFAERRVAVANYVVLLDRLDETFVRLVLAFEQPSNPVTLASLIQASAALNADVQAARNARAIIRSP